VKKVTSKGPIRPTRPRTAPLPIIMDLFPDGIRDNLGRKVPIGVPCWHCIHAKRTGAVTRCAAGISQVADIRTQSVSDPDSHGWPEQPFCRPMSERDIRMGHMGTYRLTLESIHVGGLDRPTFRDVIIRHVKAALDSARTADDLKAARATIPDDVADELRGLEELDEATLEEARCLVRRLLGSEDVLDRPELLIDHEEVETFGQKDPTDRPTRYMRSFVNERTHWSPPTAHFQVRERLTKNRNLWDVVMRSGGRIVRGNTEYLAARYNRWGYANPGWVKIRTRTETLEIPVSHFKPHPDPGAVTEKTRGFALRDTILCPIATMAPEAMFSTSAVAHALIKGRDPELLVALWKVLPPHLKARALASNKVPEEVKCHAH